MTTFFGAEGEWEGDKLKKGEDRLRRWGRHQFIGAELRETDRAHTADTQAHGIQFGMRLCSTL